MRESNTNTDKGDGGSQGRFCTKTIGFKRHQSGQNANEGKDDTAKATRMVDFPKGLGAEVNNGFDQRAKRGYR